LDPFGGCGTTICGGGRLEKETGRNYNNSLAINLINIGLRKTEFWQWVENKYMSMACRLIWPGARELFKKRSV